MAVFMSPRTSYVLGRFGTHSMLSYFTAAWIAIIFLFTAASPLHPQSLLFFGVGGSALSCKRGRKAAKRVSREVFYGCLNGVTGVAAINENDEVGSTSHIPHRDGG